MLLSAAGETVNEGLGQSEVIDIQSLVDACGEKWHNENLTRVNDSLIVDRFRVQPGDRITAGHLVIAMEGPASVGSTGGVIWDDAPIATGDTIIASLEGVLASDATSPAGGPRGESAAAGPAPFTNDAVAALIRAGRELAQDRPPRARRKQVDLNLATPLGIPKDVAAGHNQGLVPVGVNNGARGKRVPLRIADAKPHGRLHGRLLN